MKPLLTLSKALLGLAFLWGCGQAMAVHNKPAATAQGAHKSLPDRSPKKHRGKASVYSRKLARQPMADGTPLDLNSNSAASLILPLGSKARVTNLRNGRSAEVVIRDRGPFVKGRIIDLTPQTAKALGFRTGVISVEVAPVEKVSTAPAREVKSRAMIPLDSSLPGLPQPWRMQGNR